MIKSPSAVIAELRRAAGTPVILADHIGEDDQELTGTTRPRHVSYATGCGKNALEGVLVSCYAPPILGEFVQLTLTCASAYKQEHNAVHGVERTSFAPYLLNQGGQNTMSTMKQTASTTEKKRREFPPDRYDYRDDVTSEGVEKVRQKAAPHVTKADLELVDGLGRYAPV